MKRMILHIIIIKVTTASMLLALAFYAYIPDIYASTEDESIEIYQVKAYEAQKNDDPDSAILWYQKILSADPNHRQTYIDLALLYEKNGEIKKSGFCWMKAYKLGRESDFWTEEARKRLEKLGLIDKPQTETPDEIYADKSGLLQMIGTTVVDRNKTENKRNEIIEKTLKNAEIELSLEYQLTDGEQIFKVIDTGGQIISKLTYPIKGNMLTFKGEARLNPKFSVGGKYATSDLEKTTNSDEDWGFWGLHNGALKYIDYQITKQDCKSKIEAFDVNLYCRLLDVDNTKIEGEYDEIHFIDRIFLDLFGGYQQQKGRYAMRDPITEYLRAVEGSWWQAAGLPLYQGLDSPYKVIYQGPRIGLRIGAANRKFSSRISASCARIKTKAHGWWNLRDYSFSQNSTDMGFALGLDMDMRYNLNKNWFIGIGYTYTEYDQKKLEESGVQPGSSYDDLDIIRDVNNKVYGPYFTVGSAW